MATLFNIHAEPITGATVKRHPMARTTDDPMARVTTPHARRSDPPSSKIAAAQVEDTGKADADVRAIIAALRRLQDQGIVNRTATMIAAECWRVDPWSPKNPHGWREEDNVRVSRRSGDLRGLITTGPLVTCPIKGSRMMVWSLTH